MIEQNLSLQWEAVSNLLLSWGVVPLSWWHHGAAGAVCPYPCHSGTSGALLSCTCSVVMVSPPGCEEVHQGKRDQEPTGGGVCPKASSLQMDLRVIDVCSISGKDVILPFGKSNWINLAVLFGHRKASLAL